MIWNDSFSNVENIFFLSYIHIFVVEGPAMSMSAKMDRTWLKILVSSNACALGGRVVLQEQPGDKSEVGVSAT